LGLLLFLDSLILYRAGISSLMSKHHPTQRTSF
jgi:hypothetical protein